MCFLARADLWAHENEAKGVDCSHQGVQDPAVPALVSLVVQSVHSIAANQWIQHIAQISDGICVMPLGLTGIIVAYKNGNM